MYSSDQVECLSTMCACVRGGQLVRQLFLLHREQEHGRGRNPFVWEGRRQWRALFDLSTSWCGITHLKQLRWSALNRCASTMALLGGVVQFQT